MCVCVWGGGGVLLETGAMISTFQLDHSLCCEARLASRKVVSFGELCCVCTGSSVWGVPGWEAPGQLYTQHIHTGGEH